VNGPVTLSVVVALISGKTADLRRCLEALGHQVGGGPGEILVPYDPPCADVTRLAGEFPTVRFIAAETLDTDAARRGASREHHDTLRTIGLRAATGDVVALTEDHAHAAPTWSEELLAALTRYPRAGAVGGSVDCDSRPTLNWAVWFCDFGRYQSPVPEGPAAFVSDSNVAYRREALEQISKAWRNDYHETAVHWALSEAGYELHLTPRVRVWQARTGLTLRAALQERFVWARSFAGTRARLTRQPSRWVLAALSPLLPVVMTWRICRVTVQRRRHRGQLVRALPLIVLLQTVWACGETAGYVTGRV
jgi:Glycosyl transferase family 2